jgi:hypothetical protein
MLQLSTDEVARNGAPLKINFGQRFSWTPLAFSFYSAFTWPTAAFPQILLLSKYQLFLDVQPSLP